MTNSELEELVHLITVEVVKSLRSGFFEASSERASECEGKERESTCECSGDHACGSSDTGCCQEAQHPFRYEKKVLSVADIEELENADIRRVLLGSGTILTPLAAEVAQDKQMILIRSEKPSAEVAPGCEGKSLVILSQNSSQSQRQAITGVAGEKGYAAHSELAPGTTAGMVLKAALRSADTLSRGEVARLIVLDEDVYPLSVQLKRISGVNPKICWDRETAALSRDHNVLLLNTRLIGIPTLKKIVEAWLQ